MKLFRNGINFPRVSGLEWVFAIYFKMDMRSFQKLLVLFLISLFLTFSFNAYACLVPIYGDMEVSQGSDCTNPGEEPTSHFCDGFKTLAVQSGPDISSSDLSSLVLAGNMASLVPVPVTTSQFLPIPVRGHPAPPKDILVLISVFRL
jgi:hypothetical protein